ncbi:MAG: DMT family transporter [Flavobacteriales bacterium]|nr:DMT family transporter [Flavobacteriales bacterium]MCX7767956.1 DMT family transporter [Flavobacteriales bacterium]MDW8410899.1 DMT family transporter [Flavobacteriales bacterium]
MQTNAGAHLALVVVNVIYALNYLVAKGLMPEYLKPAAFILLRVVFTANVAMLLWWLGGREKILRRDMGRFFLCALTGVMINQLLFFEGLNRTTPAHAAVIFTSNPALTLLASWLLVRERIRPRQVAGLILSLAGALALTMIRNGRVDFSSQYSLGNLMVLLNALSYAFYLPLVKPLLQKYQPITILAVNFFIGQFLVLPFGLKPLLETHFYEFTLAVWGQVAFVLIGVTFVTYLLSIYGLRRLSPFTVSVYVYLQPFLAIILDVVLRDFSPNIGFFLASAALLAGMWMVIKTKSN